MVEELKWRKSELIAYLETKVIDGIANEQEEDLYIDFKWGESLNKHNSIMRNLLKEMRDIYEEN